VHQGACVPRPGGDRESTQYRASQRRRHRFSQSTAHLTNNQVNARRQQKQDTHFYHKANPLETQLNVLAMATKRLVLLRNLDSSVIQMLQNGNWRSDTLIRPMLRLVSIKPDHDVVVIVHNGIGAEVNGKYRTQ
jgi:hypothetical protein